MEYGEWWDEMMGGLPRPEQPQPPANSDRRYVCTRCKRELQLQNCKAIDKVKSPDNEWQVLVRIVHQCPCAPVVRSTRYPFDSQALARLMGTPYPQLPWPKPSLEDKGEVIVDPPEPKGKKLTPDEMMERWRWDLEPVVTAHDFLLFCRGPRGDLAEGA